MLDQRDVTINGTQYVIQQLPSSRGMQVAIILAKIASGAAKGIGAAESIEDIPINIGGIIDGVVERLDAEASPAFIKRLVMDSVVRPEMTSESFEAQFSGNYDELWELVAKIIEHNKLLEVLKKKASDGMGLLFSASPKPAKSTRSTRGRSSPG
jgi:hypothetical protein